ncbi:hypothetical protein BURMUCGD1_1875 [Burkholderia multivorans CGD1]|nr:hypothetical protein BURMUCGD1_1875 [Burkholderia multivorans CGD1]
MSSDYGAFWRAARVPAEAGPECRPRRATHLYAPGNFA